MSADIEDEDHHEELDMFVSRMSGTQSLFMFTLLGRSDCFDRVSRWRSSLPPPSEFLLRTVQELAPESMVPAVDHPTLYNLENSSERVDGNMEVENVVNVIGHTTFEHNDTEPQPMMTLKQFILTVEQDRKIPELIAHGTCFSTGERLTLKCGHIDPVTGLGCLEQFDYWPLWRIHYRFHAREEFSVIRDGILQDTVEHYTPAMQFFLSDHRELLRCPYCNAQFGNRGEIMEHIYSCEQAWEAEKLDPKPRLAPKWQLHLKARCGDVIPSSGHPCGHICNDHKEWEHHVVEDHVERVFLV